MKKPIFAKRKSWEVAIFQQKLQYDMTGSFKIRGNRSERFYAKFNVYLYRAIKKTKGATSYFLKIKQKDYVYRHLRVDIKILIRNFKVK